MRSSLRRLSLIVVIPSLLWFSHCKRDETPPPPKTAEAPIASGDPYALTGGLTPVKGEGSSDCCEVVANPELKGRMGRLVVHFPEEADPSHTRVDIIHPVEQKSLKGGFGSQSADLLPGIYDVDISKKRLTNVPVKSGHDTRVKVGVLRITAGQDTRIDIIDAGKKLTGGFGAQTIGLPVGSFHVLVAGQTEGIEIQDGKVTEF
jgi:hypothetical protein